MDSVFCFLNTLMIGAVSSALYFVARDVERLSQRIDELEEDSLVLGDYDDDEEEEEEEETKEEETKEEEKKDI